jgi:hypothetical protein
MTDYVKPQWLQDREDRALVDATPWTDVDLTADLEGRLAVCLDRLAPLADAYATARADDETDSNDTAVVERLSAAVKQHSDATAAHMARGDIDRAVDARRSLDAAKSLRDELQAQINARRVEHGGYDFQSATVAIATLVAERENLNELLASPEKRAELLMDLAGLRQAARDRLTEQALIQLQIAEDRSPLKMAALAVELAREKTAAEHERREEQAAQTAPKPSRNPEVAALAALRERRPLGDPLGMSTKNQGW